MTTSVEELLGRAESLCTESQFEAAEALCDEVLEQDPENIDALRILALAATEEERFIIAEGFLKRIVSLAPDAPRGRYELSKFLNDQGRFLEAVEVLLPIADNQATNANVQLLLGNLYGTLGNPDEAVVAFDRALVRKPDDAAALIGRGHMLRMAGDQDAALASYRRCVDANPDAGMAWWYLTSLRRYEENDGDVAAIEAALAAKPESTNATIGLHFGLARVHEKRNEFDVAWENYRSGNDLKRQQVRYDPVNVELQHKSIREMFSRELLSREPAATAGSPTPIFIVGMPRSGSTLVEQILASHSQVHGAGELPYILMHTEQIKKESAGSLYYSEQIDKLDRGRLANLGNDYLQATSKHGLGGASYITDKMPANYPHVGFIHMILPHAKIIDARRDPMATCVANYRQYYPQGKHETYDLIELGEGYLQYVEMMDHWDEVLPGKVLRVQYEDVVADLETQVRQLLEHCGLPFESDCVNFHKSGRIVNTASSEQVREPIYTSGLDYWKNYDAHLGELREVLAPVL